LVIAADGGYLYTERAGIRADALIGDFDSVDISKAPPDTGEDGPLVIRLPKEKDVTDMMASLDYGLKRGFACFHIYGGAGGRADHFIANVQCLAFLANNGARGFLHAGDSALTAFRGAVTLIPGLLASAGGIVSVFALGGPAEGVFLRGLKYELNNARLSADFPLGVSNELTKEPAYIGAESGMLLAAYPEGTELIPVY
jgi:thiamine pyrophosphokinase